MLVFNETVAGVGGLHAFIVGIAEYPALPLQPDPGVKHSFGMQRLVSTAYSAYRMYRWLLDNRDSLSAPLHSIRLLLAPSAAEVAREPALEPLRCTSSTMTKFQQLAVAWRNDSKGNSENLALFYFAGHGLQNEDRMDSVMLLNEYGDVDPEFDPLNSGAISFRNLYDFMAPTESNPAMAKRQIYFLDACRTRPRQINRYQGLYPARPFQIELSGRDDRKAPILYAAEPDSQAFADKDSTIFLQGLLPRMSGQAAQLDPDNGARWQVTVHSLAESMSRFFAVKNKGTGQASVMGGQATDFVLAKLPQPPAIETTFRCNPEDQHSLIELEVSDSTGQKVLSLAKLDPHPFIHEFRAGLYSLRLRSGVEERNLPLALLKPPDKRIDLNVADLGGSL